MKNLLILFVSFVCCSAQSFAQDFLEDLFTSTPEQIVSLTESQDYLIGNIIHPLSGQPCLRQTDLIAKGAQSIELKRIFIPQYTPLNESKGVIHPSENSYAGWTLFPHSHLNVFIKGKNKTKEKIIEEATVSVADPNGIVLSYSIENGKTTLKTNLWGICNGIDDHPSARYDPRNTSITLEGLNVVLKAPDGTKRFYRCSTQYDLTFNKTTYSCLYCLLSKEILPNGKVLRYQYNKERQITKVESLDPQERHIYASIEMKSSPFTDEATYKTHTGIKATYAHQTAPYFKEKPKCIDLLYPLRLTEVSSPFFREEKLTYSRTKTKDSWLMEFNGQHPIFKCSYHNARVKDPLKVAQLFLPNGSNEFTPVYSMQYSRVKPGEHGGNTTVTHFDGTKTVYQYHANLLPESVRYFDEKGELIKTKSFDWTHDQRLALIRISDGQNTILSEKRFHYDSFGNPISESLNGNLSGKSFNSTITSRTFSQDGRQLLLEERFENGKIISYTYLPETNLLTARLIKTKNGPCKLREFREYDDCNNLTCIIDDDGSKDNKDDLSDVTQRKITTYILRQTYPFLHMPEWIEVRYLEGGTEKLLTRTHLNYDKYGNVNEEKVYDANGEFAYTLTKKYHERGDLYSETNAIGQTATYTYDAYGQKNSTVNFSHNLRTFTNYDSKGRPSSVKEISSDRTARNKSYSYDHKDRLIQKTDHYNNTTRYSYDLVLNEPTEIESPPLFTSKGQELRVTQRSTFDALGREIVSLDANGNATTYCYNLYGSPTKIIYPDQTQETFTYTLRGLLECHIKPNGLKISYQYDILDNVIHKAFSQNNQKQGEERFEYQGTNLVRYWDKENHLTQYLYDGAGRKIREERSNRVTTYSYNALGQLAIVCEENGDNSLYTHYRRDLLGQILETKKTDAKGTLLSLITYAYDTDGNVCTIERNINNNKAIDVFTYDSYNRQISHQDALGNVTITKYDEKARNAYGQRVLKKTVTDPKLISKVELHDPYGRVVKREILNPTKQTIACEEQSYDACGNLLEHKDFVYQDTNLLNTKTTVYAYDSCNRLITLTRGFKTTDTRTTEYTYQFGRLITKTMPDGLTLSYGYDAFDHLNSLVSSDGKLHHSFTYNCLGHLLSATDELKKETIERKLDAHGNVIVEKFPHGIAIKKTYDSFQRPLSITFPDKTGVNYTYDPLFIKNVTRTDPSGKPLYTHTYTNYDLNGCLTHENLIANLGEVIHTTDLKQRACCVSSPYFSQACHFDEVGNLSDQIVDNLTEDYAYDDLSQLIQEPEHSYLYDSTFNRLKMDEEQCQNNPLDEQLTNGMFECSYDLKGNLITKSSKEQTQSFTFDPLNRLVEAVKGPQKVCFTYDPLGRRMSKTIHLLADAEWQESEKEHFLYDGNNDIGTIASDGTLKHLRIVGLAAHPEAPRTLAIEIEGKAYASLLDCQGNIRRLIDTDTRALIASYDFTAFGKQKLFTPKPFNPWQYASKRFDEDLNLIDFGKRHYDPILARWLSTDPAGFINGSNLYQYNFNNPFRYTDPDGQFVVLALPLLAGTFGLGTFTVGLPTIGAIAGTVAGTALSIASYHIYKVLNSRDSPVVFNEATSSADAEEKKKKPKFRTEPIDLEEQLTLEEAKGAAGTQIMPGKIKDANYPETVWEKKEYFRKHPDGTQTEIHYWEKISTKERELFKFKDDSPKSRFYK